MVSTDAGLSSPNNTTSSAALASTTKNPNNTKRKSFFTKISTQLTALNRFRPPRSSRKVITEFYIRLLEPHREYAPGDLVKGSVILTTEKDLKVTHLVVNLVGRVDLYGLATYNLSGKKKTINYTGPTEFEGGVILCRDQQVLCGEGRLDAGVYEFGFVMEITGKGLPSSLNFEKGSISYNISATLTRPTTVSPTRVCEHKINLVELIDIASLSPPKPRVIPLESGSKRGRAKSSHGSSDEKGPLKAGPNPKTTSNPATPNSSSPHIASDSTSIRTTSNSLKKRSDVTATIEMLKAGCLRGESIPVKISIKHTKPIKSLHGIIVTLVRQGRFDTFPVSSNGLSSKGSASSLKKGLSLTSGGSTTTFRKDLSQVIIPLIVDPNTLTTVVRASVRVPEDAFPTISTVPGQIVSFKYYIEVLVDLGGKLAGKDEFLNGVGMVNIPGATTGELDRVEANIGNGDASGVMAVYGAKVIETDRIRREVKNVVSCMFEVVVGTTDSASGKGRLRKTSVGSPTVTTSKDTDLALDEQEERCRSHPSYDDDRLRTIVVPSHMIDTLMSPSAPPPPVPISLPPASDDRQISVPLPPPDSDHLDEKTRLRMAEQALLPSSPPGFDAAGASSTAHTPAPTTNVPAYTPSSHFQNLSPSAPPLAVIEDAAHHTIHSVPSAPPITDLNREVGADYLGSYNYNQHYQPTAAPNNDKQEMERLRLLASASAPPMPESIGSASGHASGIVVGSGVTASAPVLCEDDIDGDHLPRYEQ